MTALIRLDWPPSDLWPNRSRSNHWSENGRARASYKEACSYAALGQRGTLKACEGRHVAITFHAPANRKYDLDNALAPIKSGLDAIAEVWGVDDHEWSLSISRGPKVKGGCVMVEVRE